MSQVFYRKWRPQTLAEVVGQEPITRTLLNALASGRVAHAYLFFGPRGTGKTSTGRILAKAVNCLTNGQGEPCNTCSLCRAITEGQALDLIEIDAASNRGIDEIRDLREKVNFAPNMARYKVYIIDEVHMLTEPAFNALLKTLEEPPKHVIFVLATTEVHKVPATILSRCQRFDFRRISFPAVVQRLGYICEKEGIEFEPAALEFIAQNASGSLRDAENLLEQLAIYYGSPISLSQVQALLGVTGDARIPELAKHILRKDLTGGLATLHAIGRDGLDLRQLTRELIQYLRKALLLKAGSPEVADLAAETIAALKPTIDEASLEDIAQAIKLLNQADRLEDTLPLELALVECALPKVPEVSPPPSKMMMEPKASPPPSKV
ncbi:MAG: DNA polymerase III subunit gamma/tau, partial [Chloroflexi bacterium]|nr:DNA polymerase III subunit gamma/tau [Chloroflexota bacterium]